MNLKKLGKEAGRHLDEVDLVILQQLQQHGRRKASELAEITHLSVPAVGDRIRKLEEAGIIMGYHAVIDHRKVGWDVSAFIVVTVDSSERYPAFIGQVQKDDEILECHAITGEGTHLLKIRTQTTESLEKLLARIQSWPGVAQTRTRVTLSSPKETRVIPLANDTAAGRTIGTREHPWLSIHR